MVLNYQNNTPENRTLFVSKYKRDLLIAQSKVTPVTFEGWQYSLIGFHNPAKHAGIGIKNFYNLYTQSRKKGKALEYQAYVLTHFEEVVKFIHIKLPRIEQGAS